MRFRRLWPLGLLALALASTGCDTGRKNPPDVFVRFMNAAVSYPPLLFWRGPIQVKPLDPPVQLNYLAGDQRTWDEDTYNFHVSYADNKTNTVVDAHSFSKQISSGTRYTFVLYQKGGNITHAVLESPPVSTTATDAQVQAIHVSESAPTVDLYVVAPGADIAAATPWGTLSFEGTLAPHTFATGDYEIVATEAGNRAHVLYTSSGFTLLAGAALTFALTPDSGEGIQPFTMTVLNDTTTVLTDPSLKAGIRVINGANDRMPRDVAFNNEFTPPLFPGTVFLTPTPYAPIAPGTNVAVNVTPPGNPGVLELASAFAPVSGAKYTMLFMGPAGTLFMSLPQDDLRRVKSEAKITFYDVAASCTLCDMLLLPPGTDPNTIPPYDPFTGLDAHPTIYQGAVVPVTQWEGDFELTVRIQGTLTIVSGPTPIKLKDSGLYGVVFSDNPNGTTLDLTLIDDFLQQ